MRQRKAEKKNLKYWVLCILRYYEEVYNYGVHYSQNWLITTLYYTEYFKHVIGYICQYQYEYAW